MRLIIAILVTIGMQPVWALQGELTPAQNKPLELEEGALFRGVLRLWPLSDSTSPDIADLQNKKIGDNFHIINVYKIVPSPHNDEVIEATLDLALLQALKPRALLELTLNDQQINIEVRNINTIATAPVGQEFILATQPQVKMKMDSPVVFTTIGIVLIIFLAVYYAFKAIRRKREEALKREQARELIANARQRHDFEKIGQELPYLREVLSLDREKVSAYQDALDRYQFRREWEDETIRLMQQRATELIDA